MKSRSELHSAPCKPSSLLIKGHVLCEAIGSTDPGTPSLHGRARSSSVKLFLILARAGVMGAAPRSDARAGSRHEGAPGRLDKQGHHHPYPSRGLLRRTHRLTPYTDLARSTYGGRCLAHCSQMWGCAHVAAGVRGGGVPVCRLLQSCKCLCYGHDCVQQRC